MTKIVPGVRSHAATDCSNGTCAADDFRGGFREAEYDGNANERSILAGRPVHRQSDHAERISGENEVLSF